MRVRLRWTDQNTVPHTTKIYRSDTQPTSDPTGNPLVTLSNGETVWDDTTVVRGNTYWYTFEVSNGGRPYYSVPVQVTANPRTGPGNQEVLWGDQDWGVYGPIDENLFITNSKLYNTLVVNAGALNTTANIWHKMVRNGKTLFVPRRAVAYALTWHHLYDRGLVYGVSGPGPQNGGRPNKEQLTTIQIGGDEFIVRLMTGFDDDNNPTRVMPAGLTLTNGMDYRKNSELNELLWSAINQFPDVRKRAMNGYNGMWFAPSQSGLYNSAPGYAAWTQEIDPAAKTIFIPKTFDNNNDMTPYGTSLSWGLSSSNNYSGWWPVLELIETMEVVI